MRQRVVKQNRKEAIIKNYVPEEKRFNVDLKGQGQSLIFLGLE